MKKRLCLFLLLALIPALGGCQRDPGVQSLSRVAFAFDTVITLTVCGGGEDALDAAVAELERLENLLSKTREGSDVCLLNRANGAPTRVSADCARILREAIRASELSGGAFDITIAPAVALWDFSGASGLPDAEALEDAAGLTGYARLKISEDGVATLPAGMQIDLGGIAKGYAADRLAEIFRERGISGALINLGGNVLALGRKPEGENWIVGVQDPAGETGESLFTLSVSDRSVVTSGSYQRGFTLNGVRYHHLLDAKTGWPVQNGVASVSVVTENSCEGDALSTALFCLGPEKGLPLVESLPGAEAAYVMADGSVQISGGMEAYMRKAK